MEIPKIEELIVNRNYLGRLYIQKHFSEFYQYLLDTYKYVPWKKFSELLYLYYHNMNDRPKCKCCDNKVNYIDFAHGYHIYCSVKCQTNDPEIITRNLEKKEERYGEGYLSIYEKVKQTKLKKYGDAHYNNTEKNKQTKLERYGNPYYLNHEKATQTCIERYGVSSPMKIKEIAERSLNNKIKKYGVDNVSNQKKIKLTNLERYGTENVFQVAEIKEKSKQTKFERYGNEHYSNREKAKQTCLKKYKVDNASKTKEVREKVKQTVIGRYNTDNVAKVKDFQNKAKQTSIEKYGVEYYTQTQEYKDHLKEITPQIQEKIYNTKKENGTFNTSSIEELFEQWLIENNIIFKRQYKSNEYPFACDFYFPNGNLYLEIQGYWSHGKHPFNPNDPKDIETVNNWRKRGTKQYLENIETWTQRDPLKRQWAKDHNLNWKEIFTCDLDELLVQIKDDII
jgi:hypothetical protein